MLAVNWYHSRALSLAKNGSVFLLAKWIDEGPALSYLEHSCRTIKYELCAYLGDMKGLTHDDLKWGEGSPFRNVGSSFDELEPEARRIVWGTLKTYPVEILYRSLGDAGRQILRFQAGDGLTPRYARLVAPRCSALPSKHPFWSRSRDEGGYRLQNFGFLPRWVSSSAWSCAFGPSSLGGKRCPRG
jgi:hypothetical protein